jgi:hypothetical protein
MKRGERGRRKEAKIVRFTHFEWVLIAERNYRGSNGTELAGAKLREVGGTVIGYLS